MDVATSEAVMEVVNSILEVKVVIQAEWHYILLCAVNGYIYYYLFQNERPAGPYYI
jgi:hypothetical protein